MNITLERQINAPVEAVFHLLTDFANAASTIEAITRVEVLTDGPTRVGTRFAETRRMFNKEHTETLEVVGLEPNRSVSLGCDSCGVRYRSTFRLTPRDGGTHVALDVSSTALTLPAKIIGPIMGLMMKKSMCSMMAKDLDDVAMIAEGEPTPCSDGCSCGH